LYGLLGPANLVWLGGWQWPVAVSRPNVINGPVQIFALWGRIRKKLMSGRKIRVALMLASPGSYQRLPTSKPGSL
jgi:hypothetical protein